MNQELIFTSAPRGLAGGKSGFCTVASTSGMATNMARLLESLSGYRHVYPPTSPDAQLNPVVYSHLVTKVGGKQFNILSRIANAGLDYSNRSNKIAHHIVIDNPGAIAGGPMAVLKHSDLFFESWSEEPKILMARKFGGEACPARTCSTWRSVAGDEGWAGELIDAFQNGQTVFVIIEPSTPALQLIDEALSLLEDQQRWQISFSTYFARLPPGIECDWRFVLKNSPEAIAARRNPRNRIIDLESLIGKPLNPYLVNCENGIPVQNSGIAQEIEIPNHELTAVFDPEFTEQPTLETQSNAAFESSLFDQQEFNLGPSTGQTQVPELPRRAAKARQLYGQDDVEVTNSRAIRLVFSHVATLLIGGLIATALFYPEAFYLNLWNSQDTDFKAHRENNNDPAIPVEVPEKMSNSSDQEVVEGIPDETPNPSAEKIEDEALVKQPSSNRINNADIVLKKDLTGNDEGKDDDNTNEANSNGDEKLDNGADTKPKITQTSAKLTRDNFSTDLFFVDLPAIRNETVQLCTINAIVGFSNFSMVIDNPSEPRSSQNAGSFELRPIQDSTNKFEVVRASEAGDSSISYGEIFIKNNTSSGTSSIYYSSKLSSPSELKKCVLKISRKESNDFVFAIPLSRNVPAINFVQDIFLDKPYHIEEMFSRNQKKIMLLPEFLNRQLQKQNDLVKMFNVEMISSNEQRIKLKIKWEDDLADDFQDFLDEIIIETTEKDILISVSRYGSRINAKDGPVKIGDFAEHLRKYAKKKLKTLSTNNGTFDQNEGALKSKRKERKQLETFIDAVNKSEQDLKDGFKVFFEGLVIAIRSESQMQQSKLAKYGLLVLREPYSNELEDFDSELLRDFAAYLRTIETTDPTNGESNRNEASGTKRLEVQPIIHQMRQ